MSAIDASTITAEAIKTADALIVRSITTVDKQLIKNSPIKFVGSPTAGVEHLNQTDLNALNVTWKNTPGANAGAVTEYMACCIQSLKQHHRLPTTPKAAVIGVGNIGTQVVKFLEDIGINVITYDPPRAHRDPSFLSCELEEVHQCNLICLHTPLTTQGQHPTYHMINTDFLSQLAPHSIILNAGRGAVIDTQAALQNTQHQYCLDVWENEPQINHTLLQRCLIATPHIAGYQRNAKNLAAARILNDAFEHLNINYRIDESPYRKPIDLNNLPQFDPIEYTKLFKQELLKNTKTFSQCRLEYPWR